MAVAKIQPSLPTISELVWIKQGVKPTVVGPSCIWSIWSTIHKRRVVLASTYLDLTRKVKLCQHYNLLFA